MDLERQIEIKDAYFKMIYYIGCDYDGYCSPEGLKSVIDELVKYARLGLACDDKYVAGEGFKKRVETKFNILGEEVKDEVQD